MISTEVTSEPVRKMHQVRPLPLTSRHDVGQKTLHLMAESKHMVQVLGGPDESFGGSIGTVHDPLNVPDGPTTRSRAKKIKEEMPRLVQSTWA